MGRREMSELVKISVDGEFGVVTLNAPGRRNALSPEMRNEVSNGLRRLTRLNECKVIILTGVDGNFCAGGDMKSSEIEENGPDPLRTFSNALPLQDIIRAIATGPKPVVAAVEGCAFGAGFSLAAACDLVVAADGAKFCASFGKVGLLPDTGLLWSLPRRVGVVKAKQILLSARIVEADEAIEIALADESAPEGGALNVALELAKSMASIAPLATAAIRSVLGRGMTDLETILAAEREIQPLLTLSNDYSEGRGAFIQRRLPEFKGN